MTLNYTTYTLFTQLPFDYNFIYLPTKRSRVPRYTSHKTTATVELTGVPAVPAYEVTENGSQYTICAYEGRLYWPLNRVLQFYDPYSKLLMCPDDRAGNARPYFRGEDDEKYAYDSAKSLVLYDDKQAIETFKGWASEHLIAFNNEAYIELKFPAINAEVITDGIGFGSLIGSCDYTEPRMFGLDQLDTFYAYLYHYEENLTYQINHEIGNVNLACSRLEQLKHHMKNNLIKRV